MPIPIRQRTPTDDPSIMVEVTDDGSRTLVRDGIPFHSGCGAAAECDWVYLRGGGMGDVVDRHWPRRIIEIGFGTGMAMIRSMDRAITAGQPLHFIALENQPVDASVLAELNLDHGIQSPGLVTRFLDQWDRCLKSVPVPSVFKWDLNSDCHVEVHFEDVATWIASEDRCTDTACDTIYFDPFDPQTSPDLWQPPVLEGLWRCLKPGGRLVTYCVRGEVRHRLSECGFLPQRVPGPPSGKREVLIATKIGPSSSGQPADA